MKIKEAVQLHYNLTSVLSHKTIVHKVDLTITIPEFQLLTYVIQKVKNQNG